MTIVTNNVRTTKARLELVTCILFISSDISVQKLIVIGVDGGESNSTSWAAASTHLLAAFQGHLETKQLNSIRTQLHHIPKTP
jgi:hypothetical protein